LELVSEGALGQMKRNEKLVDQAEQ